MKTLKFINDDPLQKKFVIMLFVHKLFLMLGSLSINIIFLNNYFLLEVSILMSG
jgi:hypothetical protein